jgi:flagellin-like hook-associated protein FlgL
MIQVSPNLQVAASDSGASIFMNIKNGSGTFVAGTATAGSSVLTNPAVAIAPYNYSVAGQSATLTVDGTAITVSQDVTVGGTGTGPGTLAAAIQAGLTAAGLNSYSVSAAAGGGLQVTNSASGSAVAITSVTDPSGNIVAAAGTPANSGTGNISPVSVASPPPTPAQQGNSYQISFNVTGAGTPTAATTYSITGSDANGVALPASSLPTPSTGLPYTGGNSISFNGVQFSISGTPANGDQFSVAPSSNESVFTTISNLINTLNTGVSSTNPASQAAYTAGLGHAEDSLNGALNSVLTAQSSQGARGLQLTALTTDANNMSVQYQTTIATLQNVDMNAAISNLTQEKTMLSAAQQSFVQIEGLSMFTYMR